MALAGSPVPPAVASDDKVFPLWPLLLGGAAAVGLVAAAAGGSS